MLINNVASTAVVKMVVLKAVLTMNNDNDCDNDFDNDYDNDGNHVNLFFFNLYAVVAMNIVAWVTNSLNAR